MANSSRQHCVSPPLPPPGDIWDMDLEEIKFWNDRILEQAEALKIK